MAEHDQRPQPQPVWNGQRWVQPDEAVGAAPPTAPEPASIPVQDTARDHQAVPPGPPAGWYPDPNNPSAAPRYWDGSRWLEQQHPAPATAGATSGPVAGWEHPAGWYEDPANPSREKYWDGRQWTKHKRPKAQAAPAQQAVATDASLTAPATAAPAQVVVAPSNGIAVASFVTGLVGAIIGLVIFVFAYPIPLVLGLVAVPLGFVGWRKANKVPAAGRKGLAIWGVVLGCLAIAFGVIGAVAFNNAVNDLDKSLSSHCLNHPNAPDCP